MKKSKIIIPALAMLVMSTAATVTGTVAWFTMNTTASAEGMVVAAKTNGSLVVKEITASSPSLPGVSDRATKVIFDGTRHNFYPSTHDNSLSTTTGTTGLKRVSNGASVNFETGTAMNEDTSLTYSPVATAEGADYYFDYGLFIAGDGLAMNNQQIRFAITSTVAGADLNKALSIDFYGALVSTAQYPDVMSTNFIGTLNLAGKKNNLVESGTRAGLPDGTVSDVPYVDLPAAVNIPKSGSGSAYAVRMRAYFDGELVQRPHSGNFWAEYTDAPGEGQVTGEENYLFYSDDEGSSIVDAKVGDSTTNLYVVDTDSCALTYARSMVVGTFTSETINVSITARSAS